MGDQLAFWGLVLNAVGLLGIAVTLALLLGDWRAGRSIHWNAEASMSIERPGRASRYRRVVRLVWSAPTTVAVVHLVGATLVSEVDPSIGNGGNSPGLVAANQPHLILADSDDWSKAWVWVVYSRPRTKAWVVGWQALAGSETTLPEPRIRGRLELAAYRLVWRWRPVPRVGPNGVGAAYLNGGPRFQEQLRSAVSAD